MDLFLGKKMNRLEPNRTAPMIRYALEAHKAIWRKTAFVCLDHEGMPVMGTEEASVG